MIRRIVLSLLCMVLLSGVGVFCLKNHVSQMRSQMHQTQMLLEKTREAFYVAQAEWVYLNEPKRLQRLAAQYLGMKPMKLAQVTCWTALCAGEASPNYTMVARGLHQKSA